MTKRDSTIRVAPEFSEEINIIKRKVKEITGRKYSDREITSWIKKHEKWPIIKEDIATKLIKSMNGGKK